MAQAIMTVLNILLYLFTREHDLHKTLPLTVFVFTKKILTVDNIEKKNRKRQTSLDKGNFTKVVRIRQMVLSVESNDYYY